MKESSRRKRLHAERQAVDARRDLLVEARIMLRIALERDLRVRRKAKGVTS
jgi:hypothetical protein